MAEELTVPEYTAEEFETEAPFKWLYDHRENKFALKILTQKMAKVAKAAGVKGFVTTFDAYCESMAAKEKHPVERQTDFEGQPIDLDSGEYICTNSGVSVLDRYGFEVMVCPHPILPIRRLINVDTGEERLEIAFRKGFVWRTVIKEKTVLASSQKIIDLAANGVIVTSDNAKALSSYLFDLENKNYDKLPEKKSVGRLGWIRGQEDQKHGFSPYIDDLEFDGETNFRHIFSAVGSHGDRQQWIDAMKSVRKEHGTGRLFLAASFASVILEPCGLLPFFLHAWGGTEVGKTVGLMVAASVWACPKLGDYITTFNSTGVGQEMTASFLNSLPMCIDELQIQSAAGVKDFDRTIYQLTEGVGRTRGAKTGGLQRTNTWKCCFITSGEHPISNANSGGGAVNRVIEFETAEKIYSDLVGLCAIINENYGFAGREFVEYLQQEGSEDRVNNIQKESYRELLQTDSTDMLAASASAIIAADRIATELFFQDGNELTVEDLTAIMTKKDDVNQNMRALDYILELVARNPMHFQPDEYGVYKAEVWGKEDNKCVYIYPKLFNDIMRNAGFNADSFLSWAKRRGILQTGSDRNRAKKKVKINGSAAWMICISKQDQTQDDDSEEGSVPTVPTPVPTREEIEQGELPF